MFAFFPSIGCIIKMRSSLLRQHSTVMLILFEKNVEKATRSCQSCLNVGTTKSKTCGVSFYVEVEVEHDFYMNQIMLLRSNEKDWILLLWRTRRRHQWNF